MSRGKDQKPCVGYLSGPVDARKVHDAWRIGGQTDLFGTSYLRHWFGEMDRQGREGVVITSHEGDAYEEQRGAFTILNRPKTKADGARYHFDMLRWSYHRLKEFEDLGVETAVLTEANQYRMATLPFRRRGMRFVNSFHCAIRKLGHSTFSPHELLIRLSNIAHLRFGDPTMVISESIAHELERELGAETRETLLLRPDYPREVFEEFDAPSGLVAGSGTLTVLFAGRVQRNKGVFDLLEVNELLATRLDRTVHIHIHGDGSHLDDLRSAAAQSPYADRVIIHGFTAGSELAEHYATCDIVIVPTRSDFEEGFAKSVVEGVLALRPVVTSIACPSIHVVGEACVEAEVDNPASYADAIARLANDPELAKAKIEAALRLREMFFDPPERYDRQLAKALAIAEGRR